jgi:hypothetical protein
MMHTVIQHASAQLPMRTTRTFRAHPVEETVYKAVTVGAILMVLCSLWIF